MAFNNVKNILYLSIFKRPRNVKHFKIGNIILPMFIFYKVSHIWKELYEAGVSFFFNLRTLSLTSSTKTIGWKENWLFGVLAMQRIYISKWYNSFKNSWSVPKCVHDMMQERMNNGKDRVTCIKADRQNVRPVFLFLIQCIAIENLDLFS